MKTKSISLLLCIVMICGLLASCGGGSNVRDDVPVADLVLAVEAEINSGDEFADVPDSHVVSYMKLDSATYTEYSVKINSTGINIDEYGIFKSADAETAEALLAAVEVYFQLRVDTYFPEYMPEELPKLQEAEVKQVGNYVMYAILSDEEKTAGFAAFEDALKA